MGPETILWAGLPADQQEAALRRPSMAGDAAMTEAVSSIVEQVRVSGDTAIREFTAKFDRVELADFRVSDDEIRAAEKELTDNAITAIDLAIANVRCFHEAQLTAPISIETMPGFRCQRISHPIDAVGLYVPAGTAPLPSTAIMLAVPAVIASCPTCILCTPPRLDGRADSAVLVAASRAGVRDIFKIGGAQAIAAMAYGTKTVPKVYKIFGPGNAWVTLAKSLVSVDPAGAAIDMLAGPSEVLVIADASASADIVAADLLSQAEHGVDSQVLLVTTSASLAGEVEQAVETQLKELTRADIARQALANSRVIIVDDLDKAIEISNRYAPEHLILQCESAGERLTDIRNAGSVFLGQWTPESAGDYCSGTNHVLPTHGFARACSGLSTDQFLRSMTVQELTTEGLVAIGNTVIELAELEGLDGHAAAVRRSLGAVS